MSITRAEIHILIADDTRMMREFLRSGTRKLGLYNVTTVGDGPEALAHLRRNPCHLVVSDWKMVRMDGLDLLRAVRADTALECLPFLMVTGEGDRESVRQAIIAGVSDYLVKPFTRATFEEKLRRILACHHGIDLTVGDETAGPRS
jgi:two-component system chemotaxis response regulator CheY